MKHLRINTVHESLQDQSHQQNIHDLTYKVDEIRQKINSRQNIGGSPQQQGFIGRLHPMVAGEPVKQFQIIGNQHNRFL
jgi:hypothetical protein